MPQGTDCPTGRQGRNYVTSSSLSLVAFQGYMHPSTESDDASGPSTPRAFTDGIYNLVYPRSLTSSPVNTDYTLTPASQLQAFQSMSTNHAGISSQDGHLAGRFSDPDPGDTLASRMQSLDLASNDTDDVLTLMPRNRDSSPDNAAHEQVATRPNDGDGLLLLGYLQSGNQSQHVETWCFPGVSMPSMETMLSDRGMGGMIRQCSPGSASGYHAWHPSGMEATSSNANYSYSGQACAIPTPGNGSSSDVAVDERATATHDPADGPYYSCPLVKAHPTYYKKIFNPCTLPPGIKEAKRIIAHVKDFHSPKTKDGAKCLYCRRKWSYSDGTAAEAVSIFEDHVKNEGCPELLKQGIENMDEVRNSFPEVLVMQQVTVLEAFNFRGSATTEEKWRQLFAGLFPEILAIPNPYYNYYQFTGGEESRVIQPSPTIVYVQMPINTSNYPSVPDQQSNSHSAFTRGHLDQYEDDSFLDSSRGDAAILSSQLSHDGMGAGQWTMCGTSQHMYDPEGAARRHRPIDSGYDFPNHLTPPGFENQELAIAQGNPVLDGSAIPFSNGCNCNVLSNGYPYLGQSRDVPTYAPAAGVSGQQYFEGAFIDHLANLQARNGAP